MKMHCLSGVRVSFFLALFVLPLSIQLHAAAPVEPFESSGDFVPANEIDRLVLAGLTQAGIPPANLCSDEVFMRRVYLDMTGSLPPVSAVESFLRDANPNKRSALIDSLFLKPEFADYWTMKWCDILRVKAEFPVNLWPNAVQCYNRWVHDCVSANMPYDQFARALLTSSGSNFRVGPVNFYRAVQGRKPLSIASVVMLTLMGTRLDGWPDAEKKGMEAFFSRIAFKPTTEWKEEIVCNDPAASTTLTARFPDGKAVQIAPGQDPRVVFADWLVRGDNPWFTGAICNRVWWWVMGRGIVHEPDDIRPDNPPSNPQLLEYLQTELVKSKYDLRHVYKLILNSRTYQQSSIPQGDPKQAEALFGCYPVRRLEAEVLVDALNGIFGGKEEYSSPIPEPYTFLPDNQRAINIADGSITSQILEAFGRPSRDTGLESERNNNPTDSQRLQLLNSTYVEQRLSRGGGLDRITRGTLGNPGRAIDAIYMALLSRHATANEVAAAKQTFGSGKQAGNQAAVDLAWALINTKEFLYKH